MPKNQLTDPITDQEMTFARLILAGTMTDREAAETAGLNPETAADTKAKPGVRAYLIEHRAAMQQQEAEEVRRHGVGRQRVLARLWELASLGPEVTRNSISGQIKALSMIITIEGLVPERRAKEKESAEPSIVNVYRAPWLPKREGEEDASLQPTPNPASSQEEPAMPAPEPDTHPAAAPEEKPYVRRYGPF